MVFLRNIFIGFLAITSLQADNSEGTCYGRDGRDGLPGLPGKDGLNGRDGTPGRDGVTVIGPSGRDGVDGRDGTDCIECATGPKGDKGEKGSIGIKGNAGINGPQGIRGPEGKKGEKGDQGARGLQGSKGEKGEKAVFDENRLALLEKNYQQMQKEIVGLKLENGNLKKKLSDMMESDTKIKHSFLPAGYGDYSLYDIQWQSLHMAAAAACRGSTGNVPGGPNDNFVVPRISGLNCQATCQKSPRKICSGEVSIDGYMFKASKPGEQAATFYNYGCLSAHKWGLELNTENKKIVGGSGYISYCCCKN